MGCKLEAGKKSAGLQIEASEKALIGRLSWRTGGLARGAISLHSAGVFSFKGDNRLRPAIRPVPRIGMIRKSILREMGADPQEAARICRELLIKGRRGKKNRGKYEEIHLK